jgi:hypothetical protein
MVGWQEHAVIETVDNPLQRVAERNEVDDVLIRVKRPPHFGIHMIVMAVERFAHIAGVGDEMGGAEDEALFLDANNVSFAHLNSI